jgi:hypothetical protein
MEYEKPAPTKAKRGSDENENINTQKIEELTAGVDENKSVVIRIPKTVSSYNPNR